MSWQDLIFTVGQLFFVIALIPTVRGKDKPAFSTSLITSLILLGFALTYLTMALWGSALFAFLNAVAWGILAVQKYAIDRKKSK